LKHGTLYLNIIKISEMPCTSCALVTDALAQMRILVLFIMIIIFKGKLSIVSVK